MNIKKEVQKYLKLPYTITITLEEDGTYFAKVEELPGCISQGNSKEEAIEMIKSAMEDWIETCLKKGLKIPLPKYPRKS